MAIGKDGIDVSYEAANDLTQHRAVRVDTDGKVDTPANAGDECIGVAQSGESSGGIEPVRIHGITEMEAAESIDEGDAIAVDSNGKAVTAQAAEVDTSDTGSSDDPVIGSQVLGIATKPASGDGVKCSVALLHQGAIVSTEQNS